MEQNILVLATSFLDEFLTIDPSEKSGSKVLEDLKDHHGAKVTYRCDRDPSRELTPEELEGITAVIADLERYDKDLLAKVGIGKGGALQLIARYGVGVDSVDVEAATETGVIVANTPGANSNATAEWSVATILSVCGRRSVHHARASQGQRKIGPSRLDVSGKTIGVVGTGAIGRIVTQLLSGFNVDVLAHDIYPDQKWADEAGVRYVELEELLKKSDIITLHAASNSCIIGRDELALLKKSAALINCARAVLVDNKAAWEAVRDGRIWGYGLDEVWPLPDCDVEGLNIITSPHVGSDSEEGKANMQQMSAQAVADFVTGDCPKHIVNPDVFKT